jgi:gluconokinase
VTSPLDLVIGLDLGTTNCKAVALAADGRVAATAARDYPLIAGEGGRAEQEAEAVWKGAVAALHAIAAQLPAGRIAGLGLSGAMHSLLPLDAADAPLAPALTWAEQRPAASVPALRALIDAHALYLRTGCPLQSLYHPAKLRWLQQAAPQVFRRAARFAALKEYVLFRLTGEWAADYSQASATGLLDIRRLEWDGEALELAGIRPAQLPPLAPPGRRLGRVTRQLSELLPGLAGLPVFSCGSDGSMANLGAGVQVPGQTVITVGTSGALRRLVDQPFLDAGERTWCYLTRAGRWFAGGAINNAGLALQWVRQRFYAELSPEAGYARLLAEAAQVAPGAGGVIWLPYFAGERNPHWNAQARGALLGLRLEHDRAHIARAILEAVAFCLADVWQVLPALETDEPARLTGGITRAPLWGQIVADVLGARLASLEAADASAVGAGLVALQELGLAQPEQVLARLPLGRVFTPQAEHRAVYAGRLKEFQQWYRRVEVS